MIDTMMGDYESSNELGYWNKYLSNGDAIARQESWVTLTSTELTIDAYGHDYYAMLGYSDNTMQVSFTLTGDAFFTFINGSQCISNDDVTLTMSGGQSVFLGSHGVLEAGNYSFNEGTKPRGF